MDFINGTLQILYIKIDEVYLPIGCLTDNSFSESVDMLDTTVRTNTDGWKTAVPTNQSYSISFSGLVPRESLVADFVTFYQLQQLKRNRTQLEWKLEGGLDATEYGEGYINSISRPSNIDEFISFSASLQGQGKPRINPEITGALDDELNTEL